MPPAKSQARTQKKKEQQQKILLAVLSVLFVAIFFVAVLPQLTAKKPAAHAAALSPAAVAARSATTPAAATQTPSAASFTPGSVGSASLEEPQAVYTGDQGHIGRLSRFGSKDPFAAQQTLSAAIVTTPPAVNPRTAPVPTTGTNGKNTPTSTNPNAPPTVFYATMSVNGAPEVVTVGAQFPASNPLFVLTAASGSWVRFALVDGTFSNGLGQVILRRGRKITLTNTADGSRYVVRLLGVATQPPVTVTTPTTSTDTGVFITTPVLPPAATSGGSTTPATPPPPTIPSG